MSERTDLEAQLRGILSSLDKLNDEYAKGIIDTGRYLKLNTELETKKAKLKQLLDTYGVKITSPKYGELVKGIKVTVSGTFEIAPPAGDLQLFNVHISSNGQHHYWPQGPQEIKVDPIERTWSGQVYIEPDVDSKIIMVAIVGSKGRRQCRDYWRNGSKTGKWPEIKKLENDIQECHRVWVNKR
jgi:hypothetical protein